MAEHLIDLKALLVERPDCDAGTVQQLRNALAQGGTQFRTLRDVTDILKKKLETAPAAQAKTWHLKIGVASFFLGFTAQAAEHLRQADTALSNYYLGRALLSRNEYDEALKAFDKAEKAGYNASQVRLQRAGVYRLKGDNAEARKILGGLQELASHSAEYHYQLGMCSLGEGDRLGGRRPVRAGRHARPRPHQRPVPARPRQRPRRQRRRGHLVLRALPQAPAPARRHAHQPRRPLRGLRALRQGRRVLRPRPRRATRPTRRPGCSSRTPRPP